MIMVPPPTMPGMRTAGFNVFRTRSHLFVLASGEVSAITHLGALKQFRVSTAERSPAIWRKQAQEAREADSAKDLRSLSWLSRRSANHTIGRRAARCLVNPPFISPVERYSTIASASISIWASASISLGDLEDGRGGADVGEDLAVDAGDFLPLLTSVTNMRVRMTCSIFPPRASMAAWMIASERRVWSARDLEYVPSALMPTVPVTAMMLPLRTARE